MRTACGVAVFSRSLYRPSIADIESIDEIRHESASPPGGRWMSRPAVTIRARPGVSMKNSTTILKPSPGGTPSSGPRFRSNSGDANGVGIKEVQRVLCDLVPGDRRVEQRGEGGLVAAGEHALEAADDRVHRIAGGSGLGVHARRAPEHARQDDQRSAHIAYIGNGGRRRTARIVRSSNNRRCSL